MPGVGRYPCTSCHYVAGNRRMLARHVVLIHSDKVFKCPVCPFITRYAANWYRHKRDLHGLTRVTNCELCGFFANSTEELAEHKETEHPEQLQLDKFETKYAKEKLRLSEGSIESKSPCEPIAVVEEVANNLNTEPCDVKEEEEEEEDHNDSVTFSLPLNGLLDSNGDDFNGDKFSSSKSVMSNADTSPEGLSPLKVRRSYNCDPCDLQTNNPREYLYHLRDAHKEKITVFECKYCIYASKHIQKLTRHCGLVHRLQIANDPEYQKQLEASKEKKARPVMNRLVAPLESKVLITNKSFTSAGPSVSKPQARNRGQPILKCSSCPYQTRNKGFLQHHEKTVHFKKKVFRCLQCGYTTNEKARYTKHIKYHALPKMRCEFCSFKSAYKWNMDRHMKNHDSGAEGAFHCDMCNFKTSTKQSYKAHVTNHHNSNSSVEDFNEEDEEINMEENESGEWIDVDDIEEEESFMTPEENLSGESYDYPETRETADTVWKDGKIYQKTLQCKLCDFKAAWPFELKKHEENHKSQKKHPCPLCGMRFEHIAWLTKHLRRVHQENSQAKNIAAAFELLKPGRRRPGKEYAADTVLPMFQEVLKQNNGSVNKSQDPPKSCSMLSTLLNKPLQPIASTSLNKFNSPYKSKALASAVNMSRQLRMANYYEKDSECDPSIMSNGRPRNVPTCNVCGYKTRWVSELQRHMRVHSQEKPFQCSKCKYHCKWKGDLNRHLMKYHGIKVPSPNKKILPSNNASRLRFKKPSRVIENKSNEWETVNQEFRSKPSTNFPSFRSSESDSPLDLTLTKETFPNSYSASNKIFDPYDFEKVSPEEPVVNLSASRSALASNIKSPLEHLQEASYPDDDSNTSLNTKRKYQCPFCTFGTTTASRFHVHIVQHYNRRPFMCSVCGYNSNWEWDITKHIKLKNCKDKFLVKACVLLTDETGRRNYEKYDKYLVDINAPPPVVLSKPPDSSLTPDLNSVHNINRPSREASRNQGYSSPSKNSNPTVTYKNSNYVTPNKNVTYDTAPKNTGYDISTTRNNNYDSPSKACSYDFRNIGSNFEDTPENIIVTPDINIGDEPSDLMESQAYFSNQLDTTENINEKAPDAKWFVCKHCNFKHSTKRVVISHLSVHAGIKPFRCRACGIASNWRHVIVRHVKDVHNGYMNEVEDRISYIQEGLIIRLNPNGSNGQSINISVPKAHATEYGCKICPYKCDKEFYIKFHMKQHRPREGAIYRCDHCPYFVKFKKTLVRHTKLHMPVVPSNISRNFEPNDSNNLSEKQLQYNDYTDEMYDPQTIDSGDDSINISFNTLSQFSYVDPVSPPKIKRHICENCPYKTDNKTQYLYHKQFHRPNPSAPFKCTHCSYWATMQHLLTQHQKVHEGSAGAESAKSSTKDINAPATNSSMNNSPEKSPMSDSDWMSRMSVVYVKRDNQVSKMFKCNYCPMMNKKKANVKVHQKMHGVVVNDGKFACSFCDYQCLNQGGLTNHLKIHQKLSENETYEMPSETIIGHAESCKEPSRPKPFSHACAKCPALLKSARDLEKHSQFHGAALPFACDQCDYTARHKPHLIKHMTVHSLEYQAKGYATHPRYNATAATPINSLNAANQIPLVKKIDQMLLLEASEMCAALKKTGEVANVLQKCVFCPAPFVKTSTLAYHISLHGSEGEFKCSQCDYAVNRLFNLTVHMQLHPKKKLFTKPRKPPLRTFPCTKCPAVFYKQDRFERHSSLHGKNYKFGCQHCDYSVHYAANLIKHRVLHIPKVDAENPTTPVKALDDTTATTSTALAVKPLTENTNFPIPESEEKKSVAFICDRCPYVQNRKDAVQSHQRRHWNMDGFRCPYCDYTSMQNGFLQNHIKTHIQPNQLFPPLAFMKYEPFKIYSKEEDNEELVFDIEMVKEKKDSNESSKSKRKRKHDDSTGNGKRKVQKSQNISEDSFPESSEPTSKTKVPVVVLSDIFNDKEMKKWAPILKVPIPKLKLTKCTDSSTNAKIYSKINISYDSDQKLQTTFTKSMPKLVVKISKIENCYNHYSVSTKTSEEPFAIENIATKTIDNDSISITDENPIVETSAKFCVAPVPADIEENTITSNPSFSESLKDEVDAPLIDSKDSELTPLNESNEVHLKSDESFSSDTVSESIDNSLCDKLNVDRKLSFTTELNLTNGDTDVHLANGLDSLPDEIEVKL